jgi:hypothetical protein
MQKMMNKSNWEVGHGVSMSQPIPPWIVHEMAISEGVDSALVLGGHLGDGARVLVFDNVLGRAVIRGIGKVINLLSN